MDPEPSNYFEAQAWLAKARRAKRLQVAQSLESQNSSSVPPSPPRPASSRSRSQRVDFSSSPSFRFHPVNSPIQSTSIASSVPLADASAKVLLSEEQKCVIKVVKQGQNVFFTGPAGTGKSVVLREIISWARSLPGSKDSVAITAPTGVAAVSIGGRSVHSWAGIELGKENVETLVKRIQGAKARVKRWDKVKILIIDEISMVDGNLFDKLEQIARILRNPEKPFGGIQLVLTGDFFQLPPVPEKSYKYEMPSTFAFQAKAWSDCISRPIFLKKVFRQTDNKFIEILSAIREGRVSAEHINILRTLDRTVTYPDGVEASQLFPLRNDVENYNSNRLAALTGEVVQYKAIDNAGVDVRFNRIPYGEAKRLAEKLVALENVNLKIGAQVMLIQNISQGKESQLVNGSAGIVTDFLTVAEAIKRRMQIAGINSEDKNFQGNDEEKYTEVVKKLKLVEPDVHFRAHKQFSNFSVEERWPLVQFTNGRDLLCAPTSFTVVGIMGNVEVTRYQGQTLSRVKIDLGRVFEKGQVYVALSRATSMDSLEIRNLDPTRIEAHQLVLKWQQFWMSIGDIDMDSEMDSFFEPMGDDF